MSRSLGIPVKLLREAAGHIVTVELKSGEVYRGLNAKTIGIAKSKMSLSLLRLNVKHSHSAVVLFICRFMIIPDMLKNAPTFKRLEARIKSKSSALGVGRGRAVAMRARAQAAGRGASAAPGRGSLGIPVMLLHGAVGHIVTVELKSGEVYRGSLVECEDNWNGQVENVTFTAKDGKVSQLEHVFIRGSKVSYVGKIPFAQTIFQLGRT